MYRLNFELFELSLVLFSQNSRMSASEVLERVASEMPKTMKTIVTTVNIIPNMTAGHLCFSIDAETMPPIETKKATMLKDISV